MAPPSRRNLARVLESLEDFSDPSPALEQYLTPSDLAAHLCHLARLQGDLDRRVLDLGTGTGMLAIAAAISGADAVVGIDVDPDALELARRNERAVEPGLDSGRTDGIDWVRGDVIRHPFSEEAGTVVSNPPFGAQRGNRHADRSFLETARELSSVSYTIHNEGSQSFVESYAADFGGDVTHAFRAELPIDRRFAFHTERTETLEAEVFRIEWPE
ncbi:methyltransferase domain-containing protein [Natrarchaeobius halalkaliphilus]|uniref:Methyltransferase domain-containing protein n=1 Tax=Natrarchaeobius halalkaliphilus TaxID=1679091 RepID=A0A3N6MWF3_9EURY|nr:METTL5 family protein [Natrarchaeobius halalkaliphilus]RQG89812.1 methyltransferase domain-containing protein [Natrarchaeobius halalkaliphilus]